MFITLRTLCRAHKTVASKKILQRPVTVQPELSTRWISLTLTLEKGKKAKENSDSEGESTDNESEISDKSSRVMNVRVPSLRIDATLRSCLGTARNKIEVLFYENRIRLNGEKVLKKSVTVQAGDEVDVIKEITPSNPKFLNVSRVEVLKVKLGDESGAEIKIRRSKTMIIENYNEPWKG